MHYHYFTLEQRDNLARAIAARGPGMEHLLSHLHSPDFGVCGKCGGDIAYIRLLELPDADRCDTCAG